MADNLLVPISGGTATIRTADVGGIHRQIFRNEEYNGKTILWAVVDQSAAGTLIIAAASAGNRHKIVGMLLGLTAIGSLKFTSGPGAGTNLTGPIPMAANGGFVWQLYPEAPMVQTAVNEALSLVTTGGAARGVVAYVTEP